MVKKIIHIADVHLRNFLRLDEYTEQFMNMFQHIEKEIEGFEHDEVRIVICGDLVHQKNNISNELMAMASWFIRNLEKYGNVIVVAGNHDLVVNNMSRKDTITSLFQTALFKYSKFIDYDLSYQSGCMVDDNIVWALYSIYDDYEKPNISKARKENPQSIIIGLYHGMVVGAKLYDGSSVDSGVNKSVFKGCDCVIAGDIHKQQEINITKENKLVYCGSLIQQNFGENVSHHGFVSWDIPSLEYKYVNLQPNTPLYKVKISSIDDIDNDKEIFVNL